MIDGTKRAALTLVSAALLFGCSAEPPAEDNQTASAIAADAARIEAEARKSAEEAAADTINAVDAPPSESPVTDNSAE